MKKSLLVIISLAACLTLPREKVWPQTPVRMGITSASFGHAPYYVAKDMGFFKREGLDTEVIVMNRDDLTLQALVADSIHFGVIPPNLILNVRQRGLTNIKMIAGSFNGTTYSLIALPKYKKLEDLKGSRLAVSSLTAGSTLMMMYVLKQRGLIYPRDYNVINAGGSTTRWVALQSKQVDAAILAEPLSVIAVDQGFSNVGDAYKLLPDYQLSGVTANEEWVGKNRDIAIRFLKAMLATYKWLHENRDEAIAALPKIMKVNKQYVPGSWEVYTKFQIWPKDGKVNIKGVRTVLEILQEAGTFKKPLPRAEDMIDHTYLEEAHKALGY